MQTTNKQNLRADEASENRPVLPSVLPTDRRPNPAINLLVAKVEALNQRMYRRRISLAQFEKWQADGAWRMEEAPRFAPKQRIQELVLANNIVTTGWMATSIRGWHERWIIWRKRSSPNDANEPRPAKNGE